MDWTEGNNDWLEGADEEEIRWRGVMKEKWNKMMREAHLHPIKRPDEGPTNAYGEEEAHNEVLARLVEEGNAAAEARMEERWAEMNRICQEAEGPPKVSIDKSMKKFAVFRPDGVAVVFEDETEDVVLELE
jgi:hypothetical protein